MKSTEMREGEHELAAVATRRPAKFRAWLFWFAAAYFVLYTFPFPFGNLPTWGVWRGRLGGLELPEAVETGLDAWDSALGWIGATTETAWESVVLWVGEHVFDVEILIQPTGSGDTAAAYVHALLCVVGGALLGAIVFFATRRRAPPRWASFVLVIGVRYYLAFALLGYGFFKVIKSQFPLPSLSRLIQPYGDSSPMGIVWTFMGVSAPYNWFTGAGEVLGGALLLFRRTTTLGALVAMAVMAHVAVLNYAYDVPVKLYSTHLLLMATALAALDGRRLVRFFLANRSTAPADLAPPVRSRILRVAGFVVKLVVVVHVLWTNIDTSLGAYRARDGRERPELYGIWDVQSFARDGAEIPPLATDAERWKHLIHDFPGYDGNQYVTVVRMNGERRAFRFTESQAATAEAPAPTARTFELAAAATDVLAASQGSLVLERPNPGELVLDGELDGKPFRATLKRRLPEDFLLLNRGYHWINELPFNR